MRIIILLAVLGRAIGDDDWQPIIPEPSLLYSKYTEPEERSLDHSPQIKILSRPPPYKGNKVSSLYHISSPPAPDTCSLYKVSTNQEIYSQQVEYETSLPDLKEFTLCMWNKFHNHSQDHPLFSYAVGNNPKEILAWISNTNEASYFSLAVHGQTFFRLNYPIKLNTWYHSCQSWNGKTGEWQIWVNAERVGRGFHNRLVGHVIKGGGSAVSGQDQSRQHNGNNNGIAQIEKPSGLVGEITMVQLYHVALTAGKAHKDHKHHHAHHFKHDGSPVDTSMETVTEAPPPEPTDIGNGNFLIGGQLQRPSNLNLAGQQPQQQMVPAQLPNGLQLQQEFINGQLGNRIVSEQLLNSAQGPLLNNPQGLQPLQYQYLHKLPLSSVGDSQPFASGRPVRPLGPSKPTTILLSGSLLNPANVQYIDDTANHNVFRRDSKKRDKRDNPEKALNEEKIAGKKDKRGLVELSDGSIVDEALLNPSLTDDPEELMFQESLLTGLAGVVGNLPVQNLQKQTGDEREPAEAEVKAVMMVCSGCAPEPFKKALVLSWRSTPKKLHGGAHYYKGVPICRAF